MCDSKSQQQSQILLFSALLALGFAVGGLLLGWWVGSLVIMFDGVYSLLSLGLTLLSLATAFYINRPSEKEFPFGKAMLEPIVIAIKATAILSVVAVSLYSAVTAMFHGGREVDASIASLFGIVNVVGCGLGWWYIRTKNQSVQSGLVEAEATQWKMDALLSVAVTLGFLVALALQLSPWQPLSVYADPMMMILMSFYFIKVPFDMLKEAIRELLMMTPKSELKQQINQDVQWVDQNCDQDIELTALTKVGSELRVNIDVHIADRSVQMADIERLKSRLRDRLSKHPFKLELQLNLAL